MPSLAPDQPDFPCQLTIHIPFPTPHLARTALRALAVDKELSALVSRRFTLLPAPSSSATTTTTTTAAAAAATTTASPGDGEADGDGGKAVLQVRYAAATNRMLRVAVNGFFESVGVVLHVMEELDVDVVARPGTESLEGIQGLEEV